MIWKTLVITFLAVGALAEYRVPDELNVTVTATITHLCTKNGAEDKAGDLVAAFWTFSECARGLINLDQLKTEIEESKPKGTLDEVFKKYCAKSPQLKECLHSLTAAWVPCVNTTMHEFIPNLNNATDQLLDFVCYKDGDRIAMFIAEQGPECFVEKAIPIRQCFEKTKETMGSVEDVRKLSVQEQCAKVDEFTSCIVTALEGCKSPTPGNMAESLFKFIRRVSPCASQDDKN